MEIQVAVTSQGPEGAAAARPQGAVVALPNPKITVSLCDIDHCAAVAETCR
jgi:hypothetical protein